MKTTANHHHDHEHADHHHYRRLFLMVLLSFVAMYLLMYAMVDRWENVIPNINQFYMAGMMTAPMLIIELLLMRKMYPNKKLNALLYIIGIVVLVLFYFGIRKQTFVNDKQFLKSMIPHHAAAILMVKQTVLNDPELKALGDSIVASQQKEIDFMKRKLKQLKSE